MPSPQPLLDHEPPLERFQSHDHVVHWMHGWIEDHLPPCSYIREDREERLGQATAPSTRKQVTTNPWIKQIENDWHRNWIGNSNENCVIETVWSWDLQVGFLDGICRDPPDPTADPGWTAGPPRCHQWPGDLAFRVQPATGCCPGGQNLGQCAPKQGSLTQTGDDRRPGMKNALWFFPWHPWNPCLPPGTAKIQATPCWIR